MARHLLDFPNSCTAFRIAIYGGVTANPSPIAVRATREGEASAVLARGLGDILGDQEVAISCSGGNDLPANGSQATGRGKPGASPGLPVLRKANRSGGEPVASAPQELIHHRLGVASRLGVAETQSLAKVHDLGVDVVRHPVPASRAAEFAAMPSPMAGAAQ